MLFMKSFKSLMVIAIILMFQYQSYGQVSIAQTWTEHLLFAVKNDFARPTVHARNLFHSSVAMHDAWAAYNGESSFYFLGEIHEGQPIPFNGVPVVADTLAAQHLAISYAVFRIMDHRFQNSPGASNTIPRINAFMDSLNYDRSITSIDYINDGPAALGNYIASKIIEIGYLDGSNEFNDYSNLYYTPAQNPIEPEFPGNPDMTDPNRWQPIALSFSVDQAGNVLTSNPPFLSPEWGDVTPFALPASAASTFMRNGDTYRVYHDPGAPVYLDTATQSQLESLYKWNFTMVSVWQSHLDPNDTTTWDISPASIGNIQNYPTQFVDYDNLYNYFDGGDAGQGYALNPKTNMPYTPQIVKRADYARVLAEFWADGLDSETPPGHWYNIYNEVRQHPLFENKWKGLGPELSSLEYDVKAYMTMGGAMHDCAISAWSIKGWYDYARPVSALRYMAEKGQSTIDTLSNYHPGGLPLVPGYIEIVQMGDPLAGGSNQHLGKIKLYTWRGPDYISNPASTFAGVGWILAENWWPYQRPSFVTPPFAGYVSGHSTFSRAAAEVMTFISGDPYFPGGMSSFTADENEFLEFEEGPSTDVVLEWATYRDASDQCSLSRIWGGIHPPVDDINGRLIGLDIGLDASAKADSIFLKPIIKVDSVSSNFSIVNILTIGQNLKLQVYFSEDMNTSMDPSINFIATPNPLNASLSLLGGSWLDSRRYEIGYSIIASSETIENIQVQVQNAISIAGQEQLPFIQNNVFSIDLERPMVSIVTPSEALINDGVASVNTFYLDVEYTERCDTFSTPSIQFITPNVLSVTLFEDASRSEWINSTTFRQAYTLVDENVEILDVDFYVSGAIDQANNTQSTDSVFNQFSIITTNPALLSFTWSDSLLNRSDIGGNALNMNILFDRPMNISSALSPEFSLAGVYPGILDLQAQSGWLDSSTVQISFDLLNQIFQGDWMDISLLPFKDLNGNSVLNYLYADALRIDTKRPEIISIESNTNIVSDDQTDTNNFLLDLAFDENMNIDKEVIVELFLDNALSEDINFKVFQSYWLNDSVYRAVFEVEDNGVELQGYELQINFGEDASNNPQDLIVRDDFIDLDTRNPEILSLTANTYSLTEADSQWEVTAVFDELMDTTNGIEFAFSNAVGLDNYLSINTNNSVWLNPLVYKLVYDVNPGAFSQEFISISPLVGTDTALNLISEFLLDSFLTINLEVVSVKDLANDLKLYPVPVQAGDWLNFNVGASAADLTVQLFNELGQIMLSKRVEVNSLGDGQINIPVSAEGICFIKFISKSFSIQRKIMLSK